MPKQIAEKSTHVSKSRWPHGQQVVSSIGGSRTGRNGMAGFVVLMAGSGGSELLIFVWRAESERAASHACKIRPRRNRRTLHVMGTRN
jgi:hypothetical protein